MDDLFISYASEDRERARTLALALEARGWSVWWDREIPLGKSYDEVIEQALADSRCMLVLWSKASVASEWVRNEASEGKRRGILAPVFIEDVDAPLAFRLLNGARLEDWDPARPHTEFERLNQHIAALLAMPRESRIPPAQAKAAPATPTQKPPQTSSPAQEHMQWHSPRAMGAVAVSVLLLIGGALWLASQPSPPSTPAELPTAEIATEPSAPVTVAPALTPSPVVATTPARPTPLPSPPKPAPTVKPPSKVAAVPARPVPSPGPTPSAAVSSVVSMPPEVAAPPARPTPLPSPPRPTPVVTPPPAVVAQPARPVVMYAALGLPSNRSFWSGETRAGYTQKMHAALQRSGRDVLRMDMHNLELDQGGFDAWWNESGQQRSRDLCAASTAPVALLFARMETPFTISSVESAFWPELKLRLYLCTNQRLFRQQKTLAPQNPDAWPFATELTSEIERFLRSYRADLAE